MSLLLRYSPSEGMIRSVADCPGILGVSHEPPGEPQFVVTPTYQPKPGLKDSGTLVVHTDYPVEEMTPIATADAVAACEDVKAAGSLWSAASAFGCGMTPVFMRAGDFGAVEAQCAFLRELRRLLSERFA